MTPPAELAAANCTGKSAHGGPSCAAIPIPPTDGERLMRFRRLRDESAFRELVEAHAALVWGVCWQVLRQQQDAEDAFQATFLILARRSGSIRQSHSIAPWLYRVAFRTALLARRRRLRRGEEALVDEPMSTDDQLAVVHRREQCLVLLEELHSLPERPRAALVLCYLDGRSRREAADELGVTPASVKGLLARGTRLLRSRLLRRGVALSAAMGGMTAQAVLARAALNSALVERTVALGVGFSLHATDGTGSGALLEESVATLAEKGLHAMTLATAAKPAAGLLAICTAGLVAAVVAAGPAPRDGAAGDLALDAAPAVAVAAASADDVDATLQLDATSETAGDVLVTGDLTVGPAAIDVSAGALSIADGTLTITGAPSGGSGGTLSFTQTAPGTLSVAGAPAVPPAAGTPPADVLVPTVAPVGPAPVVQPLPAEGEPQPAYAPPQPGYSPYAPPQIAFSPPQPASASRGAMELEIEYWQQKADGLQKKADATRMKAQQLAGRGAEFRIEALELDAEATLAEAEVKLCRANAQKLKDQLAPLASPDIQPTPALTGAGATTYPPEPALPAPTFETAPPMVDPPALYDPKPARDAGDDALNVMRQQLAELQAANRLIIERIEQLEAGHGGGGAATAEPASATR